MDVALGVFRNGRNMTQEEEAEFDALSRRDVRPLSKLLKRFKSR